MTEKSSQSSYDSSELRPHIRIDNKGNELPWHEKENRYCGHTSQRWIILKNDSPVNTAAGYLNFIWIAEGIKKGLLKDVNASDVAEFIKACEELNHWKDGEEPKFWDDLDEHAKAVTLDKLRQNKDFQEVEIMRNALDMLDSSIGTTTHEQLEG